MDSKYGTGTNVMHPRRNTKANGNGNGNTGEVRNLLADSKDERGNGWNPRIHQGIPVSEGVVAPAKRLKSFSSGSSSEADSSSEDFIEVDPESINLKAFATAPLPNHVRPLPIYYKTDLSSVSSKSENDNSSQVSGITHESLSQSPSVTESPPIQVMERPSGFDPDRIPASVFANNSPSRMEWSVNSNESLFSIHIGNNSFPKDRALMLSRELHKSGELEKSRNSNTSDIAFSPSPVARRKESDRRRDNLGRDFEETEKPTTETPVEIAGDQGTNNYLAREMSFKHNLEGSELHVETVVFPQKKKHERSSWSCSNCSCGLWCSKRPSCCLCKWPSCNCCAWPSCKCCKWPSCQCCKLPSCSGCCKPSCSCCKWPSCNGCCKPSYSCCKWPSCSGCCKWPSCSCCKRPSCSGCCKWPSCSGCCKWPSCSCCKCPSCSCCKLPRCSSCSGCSWALCRCCNSQQKRTIQSSKRWYSCF